MGNRYRLGRKIGSGSFGDIYLGEYRILFILSINYSTCLAVLNTKSVFEADVYVLVR